MAFFKCKMCGGTIEFEQGATVGVCDSCGTKQTLPRLDDDRKANLYDRANHFRRNNEFDKAMGIYEQILNEDATDAEAYWSLVLCKYGIEYVEDPATHRRVPTVNRAQYTSIFADEDYKSAIEHADGYQKDIYEAEAKTIDEIQKGILVISSKEEPFDVFICYKETDASGRRTPDSVLATELYHELTRDGFKVFFSRITLEDKLGQEYEPYIFAALNSAKVMVVLGTKAEHFNAVWVKNEWSRFLALIKNGERKVLIPAYKDMDPYDLPEEFSHLQAQDMSKLGFMQDLVRGIKKMVSADEQKPVVKETVINTGVTNVAPLLKRAFMFLEDGEWDKADEFCEQVLNQDPENADAYLGKLMAEYKIKKKDLLSNCKASFNESKNYQNAMRFGDDSIKPFLTDAYLESRYRIACELKNGANDEISFKAIAERFEQLKDYKDSHSLKDECLEKAEYCKRDIVYSEASAKASSYDLPLLYEAVKMFESISGHRDVENKISKVNEKIDEIKTKIEQEKIESNRIAEEKAKKAKARNQKIKRFSILATIVAAVCVAIVLLTVYVIIPTSKYNKGLKTLESKEFEQSVSIFEGLDGFKDSKNKIVEVKYAWADDCFNNKDYKTAVDLFTETKKAEYNDSSDRLMESYYQWGEELYTQKDYSGAFEKFGMIKNYKDAVDKYNECGYLSIKELMGKGSYKPALDYVEKISDYKDVKALANNCKLEIAKSAYSSNNFKEAIEYYVQTENYDVNSDLYLNSCYNRAKELLSEKNYDLSIAYFEKCNGWNDSNEQIKEVKYTYVSANKSASNSTTYKYLKELKEANYKDSSEIFKEIYAWKVTIVANTSKDDSTTNKSSLSKYSDWYFHVKLSGGEPGGSTIIKYSGRFPNGQVLKNTWDDEWKVGYSGYANFYYNEPQYGKEGTFSFTVFDGNGNKIGEANVDITS